MGAGDHDRDPGRLLAVAIAACSPGNPPIEFNHCVTRYIGAKAELVCSC